VAQVGRDAAEPVVMQRQRNRHAVELPGPGGGEQSGQREAGRLVKMQDIRPVASHDGAESGPGRDQRHLVVGLEHRHEAPKVGLEGIWVRGPRSGMVERNLHAAPSRSCRIKDWSEPSIRVT